MKRKGRNDKISFQQPMLPFEEFYEWDNSDTIEEKRVSDVSNSYSDDSDLALKGEDLDVGREKLYYISFGSGSSGNSCYIGTEAGGIIVDAGIRTDLIEQTLKKYDLGMKDVKALLLTHDHSDHVRYAYQLLRSNRHMSMYCTPRVLNGMLRRHNLSKRIKDYHTPIFKEIPFKIGRLEIVAFDVPHDGSDNMGYSITFGKHHFVLATDLGEVAERAEHYMRTANYLVIESNYDRDMLRLGRYPEYLKARVASGSGHMDNDHTAAFLKSIINPELKYVFLCHLSKDNNTPAKALKAVRDALEEAGKKVGNAMEVATDHRADVQLMALPRYEASRLFIFH